MGFLSQRRISRLRYLLLSLWTLFADSYILESFQSFSLLSEARFKFSGWVQKLHVIGNLLSRDAILSRNGLRRIRVILLQYRSNLINALSLRLYCATAAEDFVLWLSDHPLPTQVLCTVVECIFYFVRGQLNSFGWQDWVKLQYGAPLKVFNPANSFLFWQVVLSCELIYPSSVKVATDCVQLILSLVLARAKHDVSCGRFQVDLRLPWAKISRLLPFLVFRIPFLTDTSCDRKTRLPVGPNHISILRRRRSAWFEGHHLLDHGAFLLDIFTGLVLLILLMVDFECLFLCF